MKGIIFNITEDFISDKWGEDTYDQIVTDLQLETKEPFVGPGTYPDEDMLMIIKNAIEVTRSEPQQFMKDLGFYSFFKLVAHSPQFAVPYTHPKDFLMSVETIIHVEVKKLYKDAYTPTFIYQDLAPDKLIITYFSKRRLYSLMEGLINGVGSYFKTPIQQTHTIYTKDGKEYCDFELTFGEVGTGK